jgi:hypothetical protein
MLLAMRDRAVALAAGASQGWTATRHMQEHQRNKHCLPAVGGAAKVKWRWLAIGLGQRVLLKAGLPRATCMMPGNRQASNAVSGAAKVVWHWRAVKLRQRVLLKAGLPRATRRKHLGNKQTGDDVCNAGTCSGAGSGC